MHRPGSASASAWLSPTELGTRRRLHSPARPASSPHTWPSRDQTRPSHASRRACRSRRQRSPRRAPWQVGGREGGRSGRREPHKPWSPVNQQKGGVVSFPLLSSRGYEGSGRQQRDRSRPLLRRWTRCAHPWERRAVQAHSLVTTLQDSRVTHLESSSASDELCEQQRRATAPGQLSSSSLAVKLRKLTVGPARLVSALKLLSSLGLVAVVVEESLFRGGSRRDRRQARGIAEHGVVQWCSREGERC